MIKIITFDGVVHELDIREREQKDLTNMQTLLLELVEKKLNIPKNSFRLIPASPNHDSYILMPIRPKVVTREDSTLPSIPTLAQIKHATKHFVNKFNQNVPEPSRTLSEVHFKVPTPPIKVERDRMRLKEKYTREILITTLDRFIS
jgi:hypothetical protein